MPTKPRAARLALATTGAACLTAVAVPATATAQEPDTAQLVVSVPGTVTDADSGEKLVRLTVRNDGPATAEDVTLRFELDDELGQQVAISSAGGVCAVDADALTADCPVGDLRPGDVAHVDDLRVAVGERGVTGTVTADSSTPLSGGGAQTSFWVDRGDTGVDLSVWTADELVVPPGGTAELDGESLRVYNQGSVADNGLHDAHGLQIQVFLPAGAPVASVADGCELVGQATTTGIWCEFPEVTLPAGTTLDDAVGVSVATFELPKDAEGDAFLGYLDVFAAAQNTDVYDPLAAGESTEAVFQPLDSADPPATVPEVDPTDNISLLALVSGADYRYSADLAVTAADVTGTVGDVADIAVDVTNYGPDTVDTVDLTLRAPRGGEWTDLPSQCDAVADDVARCAFTDPLAAGDSVGHTFGLKLVAEADGTEGTVSVSGSLPDPEEADNVATFALRATVDPGDGTSPTQSPGGSGSLPATGGSLVVFGYVAAALVAAGAVLLVLGRLRRAD